MEGNCLDESSRAGCLAFDNAKKAVSKKRQSGRQSKAGRDYAGGYSAGAVRVHRCLMRWHMLRPRTYATTNVVSRIKAPEPISLLSNVFSNSHAIRGTAFLPQKAAPTPPSSNAATTRPAVRYLASTFQRVVTASISTTASTSLHYHNNPHQAPRPLKIYLFTARKLMPRQRSQSSRDRSKNSVQPGNRTGKTHVLNGNDPYVEQDDEGEKGPRKTNGKLTVGPKYWKQSRCASCDYDGRWR